MVGNTGVDLRRAVEQAVRMARANLRPAQVSVAGDTARVAVDEQTVVRVLLNLLSNARDAFPRQQANPRIEVRIASTEAGATCDVSDNGPGVPVAILPRLFEPFVTSKRERGTGLGLAVSRDLMRSGKGDVSLLETGPAGTTFRVSLPLVPAGYGGA